MHVSVRKLPWVYCFAEDDEWILVECAKLTGAIVDDIFSDLRRRGVNTFRKALIREDDGTLVRTYILEMHTCLMCNHSFVRAHSAETVRDCHGKGFKACRCPYTVTR